MSFNAKKFGDKLLSLPPFFIPNSLRITHYALRINPAVLVF